MPHKYWYCGTFDFKKVSKTRLYNILQLLKSLTHAVRLILMILSDKMLLEAAPLKINSNRSFGAHIGGFNSIERCYFILPKHLLRKYYFNLFSS